MGRPEALAADIIEELEDTFGLTAAIGIGPNMLLAKLCLDLEAKQTGIAHWTYADIPDKLWPVTPLSKMWGIGSRLEQRLNRLGITTVGQLANYSLSRLEKTFGVMGNQLYYHANGIDLSELGAPILEGQKSYGKSQILLRDYHRPEDVACVILEICEEVGKRARTHAHAGRTISLGIGYSKTEGGGGFHRSLTIATPTNLTMDIYRASMYLFRKFYTEKTVRSIAVSLENICDDDHIQLDLFARDRAKEHTLSYTVDQIRNTYGSDALLRAVSFTPAGTALARSKLVGGHYAE
ncbi:putative UV-damage repair protein UvrX [Lentibacillus sp. JNUCC-1]|nr:putative UV-damage repair protein UvrX [Lentibacillus sp. JNUCC-1]